MDTGAINQGHKWVTSEGGNCDDIRRRESWKGRSFPPHLEQAAGSKPGSWPDVWFFKKKISSDFLVKLSLLDVSNSAKNVGEAHKHDCTRQTAPELPVCILFTFHFCHLCVFSLKKIFLLTYPPLDVNNSLHWEYSKYTCIDIYIHVYTHTIASNDGLKIVFSRVFWAMVASLE